MLIQSIIFFNTLYYICVLMISVSSKFFFIFSVLCIYIYYI